MLQINPQYQERLEAVGIDSPAALLDFCSTGDQLYNGTISTVWRHRLEDCGIYAKRYAYGKPLWRYRFHPSRGVNEVRSYRQFRRLGIPCPDVVAFAEQRVHGRFAWCLIVTREVPEAPNLETLLGSDRLDMDERLAIMRRLGQVAAQLHNERFYHRDMKLRNMLWQLNREPDRAMYCIDCPRGRMQSWRRDHGAFYDLRSVHKHARLVCNATEWDAFLASYAAARFGPDGATTRGRGAHFLAAAAAEIRRYEAGRRKQKPSRMPDHFFRLCSWLRTLIFWDNSTLKRPRVGTHLMPQTPRFLAEKVSSGNGQQEYGEED